MRKKMNIILWMGIFLIAIESGGCDLSYFRERSIRDTGRRVMKFETSDRINRYRMLDKRTFPLEKSFTLEIDTDTKATDSESGSMIIRKVTRETFQISKFSDKKDRSRRNSMKERSTSKSVIKSLLDMGNDIQLSKMLALSDESSLKANEPTRIRRDITMQRRLSNERKHRLSEENRINRFRGNRKSSRLNIRWENNNDETMTKIRFRDSEVRKTVRLAKWETTDFSIPSIGIFRRQTRLGVSKQFSFKDRVRNNIRQETNGAEGFIRKDRYNTRNLSNIKLTELSTERNTESKLQKPRYERHLLVPKRELKIPSEEVRVKTNIGKRSRKSIRTNDIKYGNMEETVNEQKSGRGLKRTLDQRLDSSRRQFIEAVVKHRQNRMALFESGRIRNQLQTTRNGRNYGIESSNGMQNRQRTDILGFNRRNKDASSRKIAASGEVREYNNQDKQTRRNERNFRIEHSERIRNRQRTDVLNPSRKYREVSTRTIATAFQALETDNSNRKLRTCDLNSNRHIDKRFSRLTANEFTSESIHFKREIKLSNKNRQSMMRAGNKENIPYDLPTRGRSMRIQDRAKNILNNKMSRTTENELERKQRNVRSDERLSTHFRSQINNELSVSKLHDTRSRNGNIRIRNNRENNMEARRSIMKLATPLSGRFVKSLDDVRTSVNNDITNIRKIVTSSSRLKENIQMVRLHDKKFRSIIMNMLNSNKRTASNQRSEQRIENIHMSKRNDGRIRKELISYRISDFHNRRSEHRINGDRSFRSHRTRDEFKPSKLRISSDLMRELSFRKAEQIRKELGRRDSDRQQRRIAVRSSPMHLIFTSKLHSTATNSTSKDNGYGYSVTKFRETVSSKKSTVFLGRIAKLNRSVAAPKSSSSNKSFMEFYEYISEKRRSFISLILNVMLGLAVIVFSSDDKNKGFIPRRLTPFVDGFLKYTTVI
ncbi:uncharacterized protein LOC129969232 [Argiope bruennichi]|uniref:uncharacterized protein LOC129969232 n=1 Tax=Argiope bruennichi TaxID=94029 RepID=UPI002494746A|nr:uncharacterized protein LOC129969232 [Argiope bruennichi]